MKARTEELLYLLLWTCDTFARPRMRTVGESFEGWAYRNGLMRRLADLERRKFIERQRETAKAPCTVQLTREGRLHALGGRDPGECWSRVWDRHWRLVVFDVPVGRNGLRVQLRRQLRQRGFGCLQNSVWITPHPLTEERGVLREAGGGVKFLVLLDARPLAGGTDREMVAGAWDFEEINRRYTRYLDHLDRLPPVRDAAGAPNLRRWASAEHEAWLAAVSRDPLLPAELLPPGYLGQRAWHRRVEVLQQAAADLEHLGI